MKFHFLALTLMLLSLSALGTGRSPAVEDFVGIEVEESALEPQGTEVLFNFEREITNYKPQEKANPKQHWISEPTSTSSNYVGIALLVGLPALSLFLVMGRFRQKALFESASNIEVLEKYRKEREAKKSEEIRKAS